MTVCWMWLSLWDFDVPYFVARAAVLKHAEKQFIKTKSVSHLQSKS